MTVVAAFIVTEHVPVPVQPPPLQPRNVEPLPALAVSVTAVPAPYDSVQSTPQLIPAGDDVTVPVPAPARIWVSVKVLSVNVAVTDFASVTDTTQAPVPVQAPLQPAKVEPGPSAAESVTDVPWSYVSVQSTPQLMPAGAEVIVPVPVPVLVTVSAYARSVKVAVTLVASDIATTHVPVPEQPPPLQPVKLELASGAAVSVTTVP